MMRTILLATAAVLIASPALATGNGPPPFQGGNSTASATASANAAAKAFQAQHQSQSTTVRNTNTNTNVNANVAHGGSARATGGQGGQGGQGGNAASNAMGYGGAGGNATGGQGGSSGPINVDSSSRTYVASAPALMAAASGPCTGTSTTGSFGAYVVAIGGGRTEIDPSCTRRETARVLHLLGQTELAVRLMMAEPIVAEMLNPPAPAATAATPTRTAQASTGRPECNGAWRNGVMPAGC